MQRSIVWALGLLVASSAGLAAAGGEAPETRREKRVVKIVERDGEGDESEGAPRTRRRIELRQAGGAGGFLGVHLTEVGRDDVSKLGLSEESGARVSEVGDDSPAAKAGLQSDDVIVGFQGEPVHSALQLRRLVRETPAGRSVALDVVRQGRKQKLTVELGRAGAAGADLLRDFHFALPAEPGAPEGAEDDLPRLARRDADAERFVFRHMEPLLGGPPRRLGLRFQEIEGQLARYFRLEGERGVLVSDVDDDSPASRAGVKAGDVILELGERKIRDGSDLRAALQESEGGQEHKLVVWRDGKSLELRVTLGAATRQARRSE